MPTKEDLSNQPYMLDPEENKDDIPAELQVHTNG